MEINAILKEIKSDPDSPASQRLSKLLLEEDLKTTTTSTTTTSNKDETNKLINRKVNQFCKKVQQAIDVVSRSILLYPSRDTTSKSTTSTSSTSTSSTKRQRIALSFNGGKDCTVVLHLLLAALSEHSNSTSTATQLMDCILPFYFSTDDVFAEELDFVQSTATHFFNGEKSLLTMKDVSNEEGVTTLVEQYGIKAFLMGTRSTDPDGRWLNGVFWPSSKGWAPFMRINPCLDWSYSDIWIFLRLFDIDYCSLYDVGYTSIGTKSTSNPNPLLKKKGGGVGNKDGKDGKDGGGEKSSSNEYHPAYMLIDGEQERAGRIKKKKESVT